MIGSTPLIAIDDECRIFAKLETHNRTGSVKDRMIEYICDLAVADGKIDPGVTTLIEATSGNTGIALASYAASMNCECEIIMPCNMSEERKQMMLAFGARIIETGPNEFIKAIKMRDDRIKSSNNKGYFSPLQFSNPLNVECHMTTTAPEIHRNIIDNRPLRWEAFVHGSGTGGTMMGVKKYIDQNNLGVKCVLTQPAEDNATHGIQGINDGADFLLDRSLMDEIFEIKTEDAIQRMKEFWKTNGILVGISSGANILAAERYVEKHDPEGIVVTILCDRGERYMNI
jgi:cysteine synthase A